jgi:Response regulator containing CheY-like receiver domain and AraC-type DNA-binding domain
MFILSISAKLIFLIAASGIVQALLLAALLYFHRKSDKSVNGFLSLYILSFSLLMIIPAVQQLFSWQIILYLLPFPLLIGPFLYLYVRSFKETITWHKAWPHFLLFIIFLFVDYFYLPLLVKKYPSSQQVPEEILLNPASPIRIVLRIVRIVQMIIYYVLAERALTSYQKSIHHLFSETSRISLAWVRWLINGYLFLILSLLVLFYFVVRYPDQFEILVIVNTAIITPYIYLTTFKGLAQPTLWQTKTDEQKENLEKEIRDAAELELLKKDKKRNQSLQWQHENKIGEIVSRISEAMQNEKLYQETELTLQNLADRIKFPPYQVSQAINEGMHKNFYDLINGYRVDEAKRLLLDVKNRNYTILSVGFEAGFNSKTTFNTVFKKFTGLTPTEYREKQRAMPVPV